MYVHTHTHTHTHTLTHTDSRAKGTKGVTHTKVRAIVFGILGFDGLVRLFIHSETGSRILRHRGGLSWATRVCSCTNFCILGMCMRAHNVNDCPTPKNTAIKTTGRNVDIPTLMLRPRNTYTRVLRNVCFFDGARKCETAYLLITRLEFLLSLIPDRVFDTKSHQSHQIVVLMIIFSRDVYCRPRKTTRSVTSHVSGF